MRIDVGSLPLLLLAPAASSKLRWDLILSSWLRVVEPMVRSPKDGPIAPYAAKDVLETELLPCCGIDTRRGRGREEEPPEVEGQAPLRPNTCRCRPAGLRAGPSACRRVTAGGGWLLLAQPTVPRTCWWRRAARAGPLLESVETEMIDHHCVVTKSSIASHRGQFIVSIISKQNCL